VVTATVKETPDPRSWKGTVKYPAKSKMHEFFNNRLDRLLKEQRDEREQKMKQADAKRSALVDKVNKKGQEIKASSSSESEKSAQLTELMSFLQRVSPIDAEIFRLDHQIGTKIVFSEAEQLVRNVMDSTELNDLEKNEQIEDIVTQGQLKMAAKIYWYNKETFGDKIGKEFYTGFDEMKKVYPQWFEKPLPMTPM
jgi:seryl-tRNA synthetase